MAAKTDVALAVDALNYKKTVYDELWQYYDSIQPLVYSSERLKEAFSGLDAKFSLNWCATIVDAVVERVEFKQFNVMNNDDASDKLNAWWEESEMNLDSDDVELCAIVTGESFVLIWPDDENEVLESYYNDSRMVHVVYEADRPKVMRYAAKWWVDEEAELVRLTLYYPDRLEYYGAKKKKKGGTKLEPKSFKPMTEILPDVEGVENRAENPLGIVPVYHFRRERRAIKSELSPSILTVQDAINKEFADMMVASEYGAFKQRFIISMGEINGVLKNAPNEIWELPGGDGVGQDTQVGQFQETPLTNFLQAIDKLSTALAKMSRTPQYYFFLGARSDPSGEALYAMDGPLVKKCEGYIKRFKREWVQFGRFVAKQLEIEIEPLALKVEYADPRQIQPYTQAQTRVQNKNAGIPIETQLRREGWSQSEREQMKADQAAEQEAAAQTLATGMLNVQRRFDQE